MLGAGEGGGGARLMKMELWRKCVRGRSSLGWVMRMVMVKRLIISRGGLDECHDQW